MNAVYQTALNAALNAVLGITPGPSSPVTISAQAVTNGYTPNTAADGDQYFSSVASGDRLGTKVHLGSVTTSGGALSAANTDLGDSLSGRIEAVVVFIDTGTDSTSQLLFYIDGFQQVETTEDSAQYANSIPIIPLPFGINSGSSYQFMLGGITVTLSEAYTPGQFSLSVGSLSNDIPQGSTGEAPILNAGLPFTPSGDVTIAWSNGIVGQI